jgi:16S rRNA (cytosine967-C5)-methyltransferase
VLDRAARLVKPSGRIAYITCSVLPQENSEQIRAFISRHPGFEIVHATNVTAPLGERAEAFRNAAKLCAEGVLMTPQRTKTDGFFVSVLKRPH